MIQRLLNSRNLVASLLAAAAGLVLYRKVPFPEQNFFVELIYLWAYPIFLALKYCYVLFLYTTPYTLYSFLLSGIYIFALRIPAAVRPGTLTRYPEPLTRDDLFLVIGEVHNERRPGPSASPKTLTKLKNAQAVVLAYDGFNPLAPTFCYLKPYYNDPNKTYFRQLAQGEH